MPEDGPDDAGVGEESEDAHLTVTGRARQRVHLVDAGEQLSPPASGAAVGRVVAREAGGPVRRVAPSVVHVLPPVAGGLAAPRCIGGKHAVVAVSVDARRWNQACEPVEELEGAEADAGASVVCRSGQFVDQTGV